MKTLKLPVTKKRNTLVALARMRRAGAHTKPHKSLRRLESAKAKEHIQKPEGF